jgi:hypothetical protein
MLGLKTTPENTPLIRGEGGMLGLKITPKNPPLIRGEGVCSA